MLTDLTEKEGELKDARKENGISMLVGLDVRSVFVQV
jgi:hypothetical protein